MAGFSAASSARVLFIPAGKASQAFDVLITGKILGCDSILSGSQILLTVGFFDRKLQPRHASCGVFYFDGYFLIGCQLDACWASVSALALAISSCISAKDSLTATPHG